jgi:ABC-2 type transport system ATP-binding protein
MRGLLRDFAARGGTVLLSSHLLREVEATVDHLVIIAGGKIVASGTAAELLAGRGTLVRAGDTGALRAALAAAGLHARENGDGGLVVDAEPEAVGVAALHGGVALRELRAADGAGLEDLFFELTEAAA